MLKGDVPLILGMDFLVKTSPYVNWKDRTVTCYVGNKKYILPTCNIGSVDNMCDDNSFAGLPVDVPKDSSEHELSNSNNISNISNRVAAGESC